MAKRCWIRVGSKAFQVELGDKTWHPAGSSPCAKCGRNDDRTASLLVTGVIDPKGFYVPMTSQLWDIAANAFRRSGNVLAGTLCASCLSPLV